MTTTDEQRSAAFEEWLLSQGADKDQLETNEDGDYLSLPVDLAWEAYQSACAHKDAQIAKVQRQLEVAREALEHIVFSSSTVPVRLGGKDVPNECVGLIVREKAALRDIAQQALKELEQ